jgi:hypothetical protein
LSPKFAFMNSWIFFCNSSGDGNGVSAIHKPKRRDRTVQMGL